MTSVLFESHHLYYLPHLLPIIKELRRRSGYRVAASIPRTVHPAEQEVFAREMANLGIEFITGESEETRTSTLREAAFDVVIVGNVGRLHEVVADHSLAVMVYHGTGLKRTFYRDISDRVDLRAVDCPSRWEELRSQGVTNGILAGYTKLDALADEKNKSAELARKLGLDPNARTVLYAPTFYPSSLDRTLPRLPGVAEELNVVIKLHHFSWFQQRYRYQSLKAAEIADRYPRIHLVPGEEYNILPYYPLADVLVSNISSTLFEFLALDRPIIKTEYYSLRLKSGTTTDKWSLLHRSIFVFDTSALPDGDVITAATLKIKGHSKSDPATAIAIDINVFGAGASGTDAQILSGDYELIGGTPFSTAKTYAGFSIVGYNEYALNASGLAAISKTGYTRLALRNENYDADAVAPTWSSNVQHDVNCVMVETGNNEPTLEVTHEAAATFIPRMILA